MREYIFDLTTGEHLGDRKAFVDARTGIAIPSADATLLVPPVKGLNEAAVLVDGAWVLVADWRGVVFYDTTTKVRHEIIRLGLSPFPSWTTLQPATTHDIWSGSAWITETAESADARLTAEGIETLSQSKFARVLFEALYLQESRIRILESRSAVTRIQYRDALVNFYKTL
jgi:hypothetical protein